MAEVIVRFDLKFSDKAVRLAMVGAMLLAAAPELASESVSLTTYYPAPSGVYTQIIGTSNSYMARDTGVLDVGTSAAQSGLTKLAVIGGPAGFGTTAPTSEVTVVGGGGGNVDLLVNGRIQTGDGGGAGGVWLDNPGTMFVGQDGTSLGLFTSGAGWAEVMAQDGTVQFSQNIGVRGYSPTGGLPGGWAGGVHTFDMYAEGTVATGTSGSTQTELTNNGGVYANAEMWTPGTYETYDTGCYSITFNPNTGGQCSGGYITTTSGVYAYYVVPPVFQNNSGTTVIEHIDALCCPCPSLTGCNL